MELQRKSVVHALEERTYSPSDINVSNAVEEASQVASYRQAVLNILGVLF